MKLFFELFLTFFKIGLFTIGGGYAMIPLIEREVVERKKWIEREKFLDVLALAQATPGIFAMNISIFIGFRLLGTRGSVVAALGVALPAFLIMLFVARFFRGMRENQTVTRIFLGVRPAVVALIAAAFLSILKKSKLKFSATILVIIASGAIFFFKISPIFVIIFFGVGGWVFYKFRGK